MQDSLMDAMLTQTNFTTEYISTGTQPVNNTGQAGNCALDQVSYLKQVIRTTRHGLKRHTEHNPNTLSTFIVSVSSLTCYKGFAGDQLKEVICPFPSNKHCVLMDFQTKGIRRGCAPSDLWYNIFKAFANFSEGCIKHQSTTMTICICSSNNCNKRITAVNCKRINQSCMINEKIYDGNSLLFCGMSVLDDSTDVTSQLPDLTTRKGKLLSNPISLLILEN